MYNRFYNNNEKWYNNLEKAVPMVTIFFNNVEVE